MKLRHVRLTEARVKGRVGAKAAALPNAKRRKAALVFMVIVVGSRVGWCGNSKELLYLFSIDRHGRGLQPRKRKHQNSRRSLFFPYRRPKLVLTDVRGP